MHTLRRRRMFSHRHSGTPFLRRADRPGGKTAAAVRADIVQLALDAVHAERAFERTNARFRRVRRQVLVAIFAVRPKLQRHELLPLASASSQIVQGNRMSNFPRFATFRLAHDLIRKPVSTFRDHALASQRQFRALLQAVQHDRGAHMRNARMRHQHVVDDIGQALEVA